MIVPVIIAGGKGSRLWPLSRENLPKPFMAIGDGEETLLQSTFRRLLPIRELGAPVVVCSAAHEFLVRQQVASVFPGDFTLLLEREGRGTAPALCAAALAVQRLAGRGATLLALPSDHAIADEMAFAKAVKSAAELAGAGYLVTFAVKPWEPATGYGYLKIGSPIDSEKQQYRLEAFVEKPDKRTAEQFLSSSQYAWNSGIFMFDAAALIIAFEQFHPEILKACREALPTGAFGSTVMLDRKAFAAVSPISIDYAIMEKAGNVATVIADFRWSDVGDWNSVWQEAVRDDKGVAARGGVLAIDCATSLIQSEGPMLVGLGLQDMIAVATKDAVLVAPRSRAQDVKRVVDELTARGRAEAAGTSKTFKPWGTVETVHEGLGFRISQIMVNPGAGLPLQNHRLSAAHWIGIAGEGIVTFGDETIPISVDRFAQIPAGAAHGLQNTGPGILHVVEVRIGGVAGADDINF